MKNFSICLLLILTFELNAKMLTSPLDAMRYSYGDEVTIIKKNIMLKRKEAKAIEQKAKVKLKSRIFRIFKAKKDDKTVGFGILINRKVRSKNVVVLYMISSDSILKGIEIIAFNEPMEYLPSKKWNLHFADISTDKSLRLAKDIPTITGATLSARTITDGSRLAFAFYNKLLKGR